MLQFELFWSLARHTNSFNTYCRFSASHFDHYQNEARQVEERQDSHRQKKTEVKRVWMQPAHISPSVFWLKKWITCYGK